METAVSPKTGSEVIDQRVQNAANDIARVVFWSFHFSQGDNILQNGLLRLVALESTPELHEITQSRKVKAVRSLAERKLIERCGAYITRGPHKLGEESTLEGQVKTELTVYINELAGTVDEGVLASDTEDILQRIATHDVKVTGRPNRKTDAQRWEGHFVKYVLLGSPTGSEVYDRVFNNLREAFRTIDQESECLAFVRSAIPWHIAANPQDLEPLAEQWPQLVPTETRIQEVLEVQRAVSSRLS